MVTKPEYANEIKVVLLRGDGKEFDTGTTVSMDILKSPSVTRRLLVAIEDAVKKCGRCDHHEFKWSDSL